MPIELDNTTINIINGADTYQVDFVKFKGSYNDQYYQTIEYDAQWTYSDIDASVYHLGNVGIGTFPSNTKILNVHNGINFTGDLYINNNMVGTPKYKHYAISHSNRYLPYVIPEIAPYSLPNNNEYQIFTFVYDSSNNNGAGQTEYTINFNEETECDILIVGGGGAGAMSDGGGGGAGSCIVSIGNILNGSYTIKVGKGGEGGAMNSSAIITKSSTNGFNTSIFDNSGVEIFRAVGGGKGGGYENNNNWTNLADFQGKDGGCGGGGGFRQTNSYTPGGNPSATNIVNGIPNQSPIVTSTYGIYGNPGGLAQQWSTNNYSTANCGGGGGIGTAGAPGVASLNRSGVGGDGLNQVVINSVTYNFDNHFLRGMYGVNGYIGGGGGGGGYSNSNAKVPGGLGGGGTGDNANLNSVFLDAPANGVQHTGSGGGGGPGNANANGGNGGSGIVIIRCKISKADFNIPLVSEGVTNNFNTFEQTNTLTFGYNENYLRYDYYPELTTFSDTANLIAWYKFDADPTNGATLTNYGSGGTAYDATLNIASNGIERLDGYNAQYRYHWKSDAASGNYISVSSDIISKLNDNGHSICFWAKDASTSDNDLTLIATRSGPDDRYIRINTPWANNFIIYDSGNPFGNNTYERASIASGIVNNELVFWSFTRTNISSTQVQLDIYKNGIKIKTHIDTRYDYDNVLSTDIFAIGYNMPTINSDFVFKNKSLEDFRIYDRALRHEEIEQLHLEFTNNKLHAHYKFNDPSNLGIDSSSNSYDASVYGTPEHISPDTISFNVGNGSQYLLFPTNIIKDNGTTREQLIFSIWVNKQETNTGYATYFGIDNDTNNDLSKTIFFGQSNVGATYIHVRYGNSTIDINTIFNNREINVWNHYVLVLRKDGSNANIKCYVNGIEYTAFNSNIAWIEIDDYMKINKWQTGIHNDNISKHIRDFRVYKAALSATQVRYIYKSSLPANNQSKYTLQFDRDTECDILVVAGGGGGCGNNNYRAGGGGGAGELLEKYNITFTADTLYTIVVGNGGKGQLNRFGPAIEGFDSGIYTGINGDTPFYRSRGGGRGGGGYYDNDLIFDATSGGSGGGAGMLSGLNNNVNGLSIKYNTDGHGHNGKVNVNLDAGGGGGAGSTGWYQSNTLGNSASIAGKGYTSYITGNPVTYASGGYGGWQYSRNTANAGKGSGGWGYGGPGGQYSSGGDGIDGIVIIKYKYLTATPTSKITYTMNSWTYTDEGNVYYMGNVGIGSSSPMERLDVDGTISAITKSFKIKHPLNNNISLYHGNIECPRYDNIYRGRATIVGGTCIVDIDRECNDTGGLIEGTFEALNTDSQLYLQNNQTFDNVKGTIENGKIHIECENTDDEITINWIVIAERKDVDVVNLNTTNNAGKLICEHFK
jgi:hypothetical protein